MSWLANSMVVDFRSHHKNISRGSHPTIRLQSTQLTELAIVKDLTQEPTSNNKQQAYNIHVFFMLIFPNKCKHVSCTVVLEGSLSIL